jgi:flavin-dependent dehydrogenase
VVSVRRPAIETDVFVVGGGPAGLAAALAARRNGLRVVLADRAQAPIDKACGEGLMPDGVAALRELGIPLGPEGGFRFRGIRFVDNGLVAEAAFPDQSGVGIRRTELHKLLVEAASDAGVIMHWRATIGCADPAAPKLGDQHVRCRWLIGADGAQSRVRQYAGLLPAWSGLRRIGLRQHFSVRPWSDFVEVHWHRGMQAYVTPIGPTEICIAVLGSARPAGLPNLPALFPSLAKRLAGAEPLGPPRGALSMCFKLRRVTQRSIALVGDASGAVDAITGEGVSLAIRQAVALGRALGSGDLALYEAAHRRMSRVPLWMARLLLLMARNEDLRRRALGTLAAHPSTFEHLLAVHVGARSGVAGLSDLCGFALQLLLHIGGELGGPPEFRGTTLQ